MRSTTSTLAPLLTSAPLAQPWHTESCYGPVACSCHRCMRACRSLTRPTTASCLPSMSGSILQRWAQPVNSVRTRPVGSIVGVLVCVFGIFQNYTAYVRADRLFALQNVPALLPAAPKAGAASSTADEAADTQPKHRLIGEILAEIIGLPRDSCWHPT